jgi:hypothetical protein
LDDIEQYMSRHQRRKRHLIHRNASSALWVCGCGVDSPSDDDDDDAYRRHLDYRWSKVSPRLFVTNFDTETDIDWRRRSMRNDSPFGLV